MSERVELIHEQTFANTDTIEVTHNYNGLLTASVVVSGVVRYDLIDRLELDLADPSNKLTIYLKSANSGTAYLYSVAGVISTLPSPVVTAALQQSGISQGSIIATTETVAAEVAFVGDPPYKEERYDSGQLVQVIIAAGYNNGNYINPRNQRDFTYSQSSLTGERFREYDENGTLISDRSWTYTTEKVTKKITVIRRFEV